MTDAGLLLLRLALAAVSMAHGAHTLFGAFGGPGSGVGPGGLAQTAAQFTAMGLPGISAGRARPASCNCWAACSWPPATSRGGRR